MDNLCHTLVGAALGQAGLKRRTRYGMATLMIGANLPDVDVLAIPFGGSFSFRRGWTHGSVAWIVLPLLLTAGVVAWSRVARASDRPTRPAQVLLLAFLAVLSHPFFDWLNDYGVRLLMPFSEEWYYGDAVFIVDPWIWLALGLGYAISRRGEIAGRAGWTRPARVALAGVGLYVSVMVMGSAAAHSAATRAIEEQTGVAPDRLMAAPVAVDPTRRALVFEADGGYGFGEIAWRPGPRIALDPGRLPKLDDHPAAVAARDEAAVSNFLLWARFPFYQVTEGDRGMWVEVGDARYATPDGGGWASVRVFVPPSRGG